MPRTIFAPAPPQTNRFRNIATRCLLAAALCTYPAARLHAQETAPPPPAEAAPAAPAPDKPMPELKALMHEVITHQRAAEERQKDYIFREVHKVDELGSHNEIKKSYTIEYDIFWLQGVRVEKMVRRDNRDLTPAELKKEDEKVDKQVEKGKKRQQKQAEKADEANPDLQEETRLSRMLEVGSFSNMRRETLNGRPTLLVDFTGDPKAKKRMPIHDMDGTIAVDETDRAVEQVKGEFVNDFKILGGLAVKIDKGTRFELHNTKVNDEVWLPANFTLEGQARVLLLLAGHVHFAAKDTDYRKFKASSRILPGFTESKPETAPPH